MNKAERRERNRAWHWKRRARGLCTKCGKPYDGPCWYCPTCRKADSHKRVTR
jgi:hypothetical protein